jgi:hypothetical protein
MRVIAKILTALLVVTLLTAFTMPAFARPDGAPSTCSSPPASSDLLNLKGHGYLNYNKLIQELNKIERSDQVL